jgi:hypothetical protein
VVAPLVTMEEALAQWQRFEEFRDRLLKPSDYQTFKEDGEERRFIKKSGWWRLGIFYGVDVRILDERIFHRHDPAKCLRIRLPDKYGDVGDCGCPVTGVRYQLELKHPYGRVVPGVGIATFNEKRAVYTRVEHDLAGKAFTRAVNRGITLLIGGGDATAEEKHEVEGLAKEERVALKVAWESASPLLRAQAIKAMLEVTGGRESSADKDVYVAFLKVAESEDVAVILHVLDGSGGFDPDEMPGGIEGGKA